MSRKIKKHQCGAIIEKGFKEAHELIGDYLADIDQNIVRDTCKRFLEGSYKNRIKRALTESCEKINKDFSWISSNRTPFDFFVRTQLMPYFNYNLLDYAGAIRLGAAVWMLEELDKAGNLEEAKKYLIEPEEVYQNIEGKRLFNIEHLRYPANLIEAMSLLITFRYFQEYKRVRVFHLASCIIPDDMMNGNKLSEKYEKVISLLPPEDIKIVCDDFRTKIWEVTTLLIKCQNAHVNRIHQLKKEISLYTKEVKEEVFPTQPIGPVSTLKGMDLVQPCSPWNIGQPVLNKTSRQFLQMMEMLDEAEHELRASAVDFWSYFHMSKEELMKKSIPEEICNEIISFDIANPFAYCFALIHLIDLDDNAPWLLYSGCLLMIYVYGKLPWGDITDSNNMKCIYGRSGRQWLPEYGVTEKEVYENKQNFYDYYNHRVNGLNLAQILYRSSEVVLPYDVPVYPDVALKFLRGNEDLTLEYYVAAATGLLKVRKVNGELPKEKEEETKDESVDVQDLQDQIQKLRAELDAKEEENKKVKSQLNDAVRTAHKAEDRLKEAVDSFKNDKRELSDLREYVFNAENEIEETIKDNAEEVTYPYKLQKNMVVFGGHDTFINVMKANFPDLKFYESRGNVKSDIVKNADIIWVQPNCISHPQYWNAIRYAKSYNKPIRYFVAAGTERCSRQMIEADKENMI